MTAQLATLLQDALGPEYRLEQELAGGGMSRVFLATDLRHDRRVVVKVLSPELVSPTSIARFKREIDLTIKLQHPHILPVLTSGSWDDVLYYITPYIAGESLRDRIQREGKLPLDDIVKILRDVSGALAFAHARGVVHRDIKPGNILLSEGHAILADFGIARRSSDTATPLTYSGVMLGTPAYMAPGPVTDEQADVYAVGIVGLEMLTGRLPGRPTSVHDLVATRGNVASDRSAIVRSLATVLRRAVTPTQGSALSAADLASALTFRDNNRSRTGFFLAGLGAAAMALGALLWLAHNRSQDKPEHRNPYLVLSIDPQIASDSAQAAAATGNVRNALTEWREDSLVDQRAAEKRWSQIAFPQRDLSAAFGVAKALGAHTLVWGTLGRSQDSATLRIGFYDVGTRRILSSVESRYAALDTSGVTAARLVVSKFLRGSAELPWTNASDTHSASLEAWRRYDAGRSALQRWDLTAAEQAFRTAIATEPGLARAHLWLAQTLYWQLDPRLRDERGAEAKRAMFLRSQLAGRDTLLAQALDALADTQFPVACALYRDMIRGDSADLVGWLGLSDCQQRDPAVVRDVGSRSGWRFRASFADAERALRRASYIAPASMDSAFRPWYVAHLRRIVDVGELRFGLPLGGGDPMYARPYLDHDTLAFVPYGTADIASGKADPPPTARDAAEQYANAIVQRAIDLWVARAPNDPGAWMELAKSAELTNGATLAGKRYTAIEVVQRASRLAADSSARVSLAVMEVRLLLKGGDFERVQPTADSALSAGAALHPEITGVAGLAAILGHVSEAADLFAKAPLDAFSIQLPDGKAVTASPPILDASRRLIAYASFGAPTDTLRGMVERVTSLVDRFEADSGRRSGMRDGIVLRALTMTYPEDSDGFVRQSLAGMAQAPILRMRVQLALARGNRADARLRLDSLRRQRAGAVSAAPAMDGVLRRAQLSLALGDTVDAVTTLDGVLLALPSLGVHLLDQVSQSAALVAAMALRARLAIARNDTAVARRWARAVVSLWRGADPFLQPVVSEMKAISRR